MVAAAAASSGSSSGGDDGGRDGSSGATADLGLSPVRLYYAERTEGPGIQAETSLKTGSELDGREALERRVRSCISQDAQPRPQDEPLRREKLTDGMLFWDVSA